jgi:hypothetical protein
MPSPIFRSARPRAMFRSPLLALVLMACGGETSRSANPPAQSQGGSSVVHGISGGSAGNAGVAGSPGGASPGSGGANGGSGATGGVATVGGAAWGGVSTGGALSGGTIAGLGGSAGAATDGGAATGGTDGGTTQDASSDVVDLDAMTFTEFCQFLSGIWLVGWSGGLNHYSWIRFSSDASNCIEGRIDILDPPNGAPWSPFWPCQGTGRWTLTQRPQTVQLSLPPGCGDDATDVFTFVAPAPAPSWPAGTLFQVTLERTVSGTFDGFKYPDSQCDADMTTCQSP